MIETCMCSRQSFIKIIDLSDKNEKNDKNLSQSSPCFIIMKSCKPVIGILSLPVQKNRNFFNCSSENSDKTSQKSLEIFYFFYLKIFE